MEFRIPADAYDNGDSVTLTLSKDSAVAVLTVMGIGFHTAKEIGFPRAIIELVDEVGKALFATVREHEPDFLKSL